MGIEIVGLIKDRVWDQVPRPTNKLVVGAKYAVYAISGRISREERRQSTSADL